jgi:hypothetical protein
MTMTAQDTNPRDSIAASYKDLAAKLAEHLCQQAALKIELSNAANEAQAAGLQEFADLFTEMAATLGGSSAVNGKAHTPAGRRRGRPAKPADDQTAVA